MEPLKHECGVAMVRLLKPLEYYQEKYGTWMYGLNKLYLMMEKQHNRGQEGAGMACVNLAALPGHEYVILLYVIVFYTVRAEPNFLIEGLIGKLVLVS